MPRISRPVAIGYPHHITQRGNYQQKVFESDADYLQYLQWLQQYSKKYSLKIWAYCLMNNHVHFIADIPIILIRAEALWDIYGNDDFIRVCLMSLIYTRQ